jgi:hypothetical protein
VKWQTFESTDEYGKIDLNKPLGMEKEATGYAVTTFDSTADRDAELRLGCKNAWKVWLNGELLFGRDEYHRGQQMDQYKMKARLKKGSNTVLVKCCQTKRRRNGLWNGNSRFACATAEAQPRECRDRDTARTLDDLLHENPSSFVCARLASR